MVYVKTSGGVGYCIDETPVTQKQYAEFLASTKSKPGSEHEICELNKTYEPQFHGDDIVGLDCAVAARFGDDVTEDEFYTPDSTPDRPVFCVDWCDAVAFCKWAGKRLCGRVRGGSIELNEYMPPLHVDPGFSQWHNACTSGGATDLPYGDEVDYDPDACGTEEPNAWRRDVKSRPECRGKGKGFEDVYDMAGPWAEYEDVTRVEDFGFDVVTSVHIRGSRAAESRTSCTLDWVVSPLARPATFRCCKD